MSANDIAELAMDAIEMAESIQCEKAGQIIYGSAFASVLCREIERALISVQEGTRLATRAESLQEAAAICRKVRSGVTWGAGKGVGNLAFDTARGICADAILQSISPEARS